MGSNISNDKRIRIIIGHYGSGKTEFAVNYALALSKRGKHVSLCDLDIVNPYFRSREKAEMLESAGITVISGARGHQANLDIPMISAAILGPLQQPEEQVILDVGGDSVGARVLARYHPNLKEGDYDMFCVINANREQTQDVQGVLSHIKAIEATAGLKVTGLINNTHMLRETTTEDVMRGQLLSEEVSRLLEIPVKYISTLSSVAAELEGSMAGEIFPIRMVMREDWM
ncbi:ATP-binding protein [Fusibacter paucivorans]|uniref:ATP-binding protein n=1 Tax=Fusibacter paucivorans TaxID=76009 RepID=A0ABS5PPS7_9FIRM|nr:ATP-binding protein [Fusibacter paucivorans]MBS7526022.1 ATP-binding protein [Fusibacter paucivorans]